MDITLIIEAEQDWAGFVEELAGRRWRVSSDHNVTTSSYRCISYTWGAEKVPNLFGIDGDISSKTRGALEAAIASTSSSATAQSFWIDAVCVPREGPLRRSTLESMGNIYSGSQSTIIVLQTPTWEILRRDARSREPYTEHQLAQLNEDEWINSVWTYQELVNAPKTIFTAPGLAAGIGIEGEDFLNSIGTSLMSYRKHHNLSTLETRKRYPALEALEDAVLDWRVAGYMERSMLVCLTGIAGRYCDPARPTNRLYALLGALTQEPSWGSVDETVPDLAEKAMRICDAKGDYSYIYTSDRRRDDIGHRWRPRSEAGLHPIVRWNGWGERQQGSLIDGKLVLHGMVRLDLQAEQPPEVINQVLKWLQGFAGFHEGKLDNDEHIVQALPELLRSIGFTGSSVCHRCSSGFILTQEELKPGGTLEAYASGSIAWVFGAPGMTILRSEDANDTRYSAIVHIGRHFVNTAKASVLLEG